MNGSAFGFAPVDMTWNIPRPSATHLSVGDFSMALQHPQSSVIVRVCVGRRGRHH